MLSIRKRLNGRKMSDATVTIPVKLRFTNDEGDTVTEDFKMSYYALSPKKSAEIDEWASEFDRAEAERIKARDEALEKAEAEGADAVRLADIKRRFEDARGKYLLAEMLARMVHSFPEIVDDDDRPIQITADELAGWDSWNLTSIRNAIQRDTNPND